jgi:RNA polymerase sigma-70 factor, ECF subfamily
MQKDDEYTIIEQAKTDPQAFGLIFDRYYKKILAYTVRRTNNISVAEEIVSETFVKAYKGLPKFKWRGISIEAWLFRIAINELRMHFRRHPQVTSLDDLYQKEGFEPQADYDLAQEALEAQEKLIRHKQFIQAQELIRNLPPAYQDVLVLRFAEQKKISEIAQIIGKKEGTVKSLLSRGLARLREELSKNQVQPIKQERIIKDERNS